MTFHTLCENHSPRPMSHTKVRKREMLLWLVTGLLLNTKMEMAKRVKLYRHQSSRAGVTLVDATHTEIQCTDADVFSSGKPGNSNADNLDLENRDSKLDLRSWYKRLHAHCDRGTPSLLKCRPSVHAGQVYCNSS